MILKLVRTPGIYLVGFMGSGKTAVGRILADRLGWCFADLDEDIECAQGMAISEIFDRFGEQHFRTIETEALRKRVRMVGAGRPLVLALGGGTFAQAANFDMIEYNGVSVWLDCPFPEVCARIAGHDNRPLARDPVAFARLYEARRESYTRADFRIEAGGRGPEQVADAILALPLF